MITQRIGKERALGYSKVPDRYSNQGILKGEVSLYH
jgi:hypothetical protein